MQAFFNGPQDHREGERMVWIYVRTPEEPKCMRISLHFPQWLALNRLVLASILKSREIPISQDQSRQILRQLRQVARRHRKLVLVDVEAADGTSVKIRL